MKRKRKYNQVFLFAIIIIVSILSSCSSTKYVPDDRYLLKDLKIVVDNEEIDKTELKSYLRQEENLQILGFLKFHLGLYNISSKKKVNSWLKRIGEPPVIYDRGLTEKSRQQITQYLKNKGYSNPKVEIVEDISDKKMKLDYNINTGKPITIRKLKTVIKDKELEEYISAEERASLIQSGDILDRDILDKERDRISRNLSENGFYKFDPEYIHYIAKDTALLNHQADLEMHIEPYFSTELNKEISHKQYKINDITFYLSFDDGAKMRKQYSDTLIIDGIKFLYSDKIPLNPKTLLRSLRFKKGELYNIEGVEKTNNTLLALKQFKFIRINFSEAGIVNNDFGYLNGEIHLSMLTLQNASIDLEGTNTSGDIGVAGNLKYQHRNVFHSAEILDINLKLAKERQRTKDNALFNTTEYGIETKVTIPRFLFPFIPENIVLKNTLPKTTFSISYNYQQRPNYTRTIANSTLGYNWKSGLQKTHYLNLLDLNLVRIFEMDTEWLEKNIKDLYFRSSYINHVISASSYSFVYNTQDLQKQNDYDYLRVNLESAGNILYGLNSVFSTNKYIETDSLGNELDRYYNFFGTRFAQYVRSDIEYRRGIKFDKYNTVAFRAFAGIALPYGNTPVMPFEKRYFTGGANGIRAWQVRTLGPGSFKLSEDAYPNQSADIKIEANIEYRFKLFWLLEGALFLDAGNIWTIKDYEETPGAVFKLNNFYKEIAVGTGFGTRFVTKYFILRADIGLKLRDPAEDLGERFIPINRGFNSEDFNFSIAIGYPF